MKIVIFDTEPWEGKTFEALSTGKLGAAGLDVLPGEPVVREEVELLRSYVTREHDRGARLAGHVLPRLKNVVITPHTGFDTRAAVQRSLDTTRANMAGLLDGDAPSVV